MSIDMLTDTFIDSLTDKEEGGGRKEWTEEDGRVGKQASQAPYESRRETPQSSPTLDLHTGTSTGPCIKSTYEGLYDPLFELEAFNKKLQ